MMSRGAPNRAYIYIYISIRWRIVLAYMLIISKLSSMPPNPGYPGVFDQLMPPLVGSNA